MRLCSLALKRSTICATLTVTLLIAVIAAAQAPQPRAKSPSGLTAMPLNQSRVDSPQQKPKHQGKKPGGDPSYFLPPFANNYAGGIFAVGDLNGDGIPDMVLSGPRGGYCFGGAAVLLGNGDGTFGNSQSPTCYDVDSESYLTGLVIADINGDGKLDIIISAPCDDANSCATGNAGVLLGNGDGTFQPVTSNTTGIPAAGFGYAVAGDVNGDGKPDVVGFGAGVILVLLGNGDGTLQPPVSYNPPYADSPSLSTQNMGGGGIEQLILADVNGDLIPDVVMLAYCSANNDCSSGAVGFLLGNGDGTFQSSSSSAPLLENTFHTGGYLTNGMAVGDLNNDGIPDIVTASYGTSSSSGVVSVSIGLGGGFYPNPIFSPAVDYYSGGQLGSWPGIADVNGDGIQDMVILNSTSLGILLGNGDGTFQPAMPESTGNYYAAGGMMILSDLNGDGITDIVAQSSYNFVMLGTLGNPISTATSISSSLNPSQNVQAVTFTALVTPKGPSPPTGTVQIYDGTTLLGSPTLSAGSATFTTSTLIPGSHSITAVYSGNSNYQTSTSSVLTQTVTGNFTTATSLASSLNPADINVPVTYTATITSQSGGAVSGTLTFKDGTTTVATLNVSANQAAYTTSYTRTGIHTITAVYSGDAGDNGSTSPVLDESVTGTGALTKTTTAVTSSLNPSLVNESVTFTATVTWAYGSVPNGETVTFYDGATSIGTGATNNGVVTLTTSTLTAKTHTIKATYSGDATFKTSSGTIKQVVDLYSTATKLSSSPNPSSSGQKVTLTAQVTTTGTATPTGTVKFLNGTSSVGSATLNSSGVAALTTTKLPVGSDALTATYNGDSLNAKSTSSVVTETVN